MAQLLAAHLQRSAWGTFQFTPQCKQAARAFKEDTKIFASERKSQDARERARGAEGSAPKIF